MFFLSLCSTGSKGHLPFPSTCIWSPVKSCQSLRKGFLKGIYSVVTSANYSTMAVMWSTKLDTTWFKKNKINKAMVLNFVQKHSIFIHRRPSRFTPAERLRTPTCFINNPLCVQQTMRCVYQTRYQSQLEKETAWKGFI